MAIIGTGRRGVGFARVWAHGGLKVVLGGDGSAADDLARELAGKVVVDSVAPLGFDGRGPYALPLLDGSATEQAASLLPTSRVVGAFHHLSAGMLEGASSNTAIDTLVFGDDRGAVDTVVSLAALIPGVRGLRAGRLRDAQQVEALTANLIAMNAHYGVHPRLRFDGPLD